LYLIANEIVWTLLDASFTVIQDVCDYYFSQFCSDISRS
jgi:hypothetical protein